MTKTLLYIHGVIDDDPDRRWVSPLDAALENDGGPGLAELGWDLPHVSYLDLLEADDDDVDDGHELPPETYRAGDDSARIEATAAYLARLGSLQRALGDTRPPSPPSWAPGAAATDWSVRNLNRPVFRWAREYTSSPHKRAAILQRVLEAVPREGELILFAHSLGSVVAADLVYHLPPGVRLRLLVSSGSPLSLETLRKHLRRVERKFPVERVGAWLNLAGVGDPVTYGRGLTRHFPEVFDRIIDTGRDFKLAHDVVAYAGEGTLARAVRWASSPPARAGAGRSAPLPEVRVPDEALLPLTVMQHAYQLEQALPKGARRERFAKARMLRAQLAAEQLGPVLEGETIVARFGRDNVDVFLGRLRPLEQVQLLLAARRWNPIEPWEIDVPDGPRRAALRGLAADLGAPADWANVVWKSEAEARESQNARWSLGRAALVGAGVLAVVAAPAMVLAAAPAGLAGGAAVAGGLAALGPGGVVGGLAVVGAVSGAGGAVAARGLSAGSATAVEENVIAVQALALAVHRLDLASSDAGHWYTLVAMEQTVADELRRLRGVSDSDAEGIKELERKLKAIQRGLEWMIARRLGPKPLDQGDS